MGKVNVPFVNFNGGEVGEEIQARVQLEGYQATARRMENMWAEVEGGMMLRPGLEFVNQPNPTNDLTIIHPFVVNNNDAYVAMFSNNALRIYDPDVGIVTRPAVTCNIVDGNFPDAVKGLGLTGTYTASSTASGSAPNLGDVDDATIWQANTAATAYVYVDLAASYECREFLLESAATNAATHTPSNFELHGSATGAWGGEEVLLYTSGTEDDWFYPERRYFTITNPGSYRYYRLTMTGRNNNTASGSYRLSSFRLNNSVWLDASGSNPDSWARILGVDDVAQFQSDGVTIAGLEQEVTTSSSGTVHAIEVDVARGPVNLEVGSSRGGSDLIQKLSLATGFHSLAFLPTTGTFWVKLSSSDLEHRQVNSISIAGSGDMVIATEYQESLLRSLKFVRSTNTMYIASGVGRRMKLQRRGGSSWSLVETSDNDGPFLTQNFDPTIRLSASQRTGNGTLTSSVDFFKSGHVGALFQLNHVGQYQAQTFVTDGQVSNPVKITGIGTSRQFVVNLTGSFTGKVRLQKSVGVLDNWIDDASYTAPGLANINDGHDNLTVYYRLATTSGDLTSGVVLGSMAFVGGLTKGVARVTEYVSPTEVKAEILVPFGASGETTEWREGAWSDVRSWPKALALFSGRLWSASDDVYWASKSDAFEVNDEGDILDADAFSKNIATDDTNPSVWMLGLARLVIGTQGQEHVLRSTNFDEALTFSNITGRDIDTLGSADVQPIKIGKRGIFVDKSTYRSHELVYDIDQQDYRTSPLMRLHRDIGKPGLHQISSARQPETRLFYPRADGQLLTKIYNPSESVLGWSRVITDGEIESTAILPGVGEDRIYAMVKRTVNGSIVRYFERFDLIRHDTAAEYSSLDSYVRHDGAATTTIAAPHLIGKTVRVWANGARLEDKVVDGSGNVTLDNAMTPVVVGLPYYGKWESSKLSVGAKGGTALAQKGKPLALAFILHKSSPVFSFGMQFSDEGGVVDSMNDRQLDGDYDSGSGLLSVTTDFLNIEPKVTNDPRICIECEAPFPVRLLGFVTPHHLDEEIKG